MGGRVQRFDWAATPLGPFSYWPPSLKTAAGICLSSKFPMCIWWGEENTQIYNDAYVPILGDKHPRSLGQPGHECWAEVWDVAGPLCAHVRESGEAIWSEDLQLMMARSAILEETYFTMSYSPIEDEGGAVGGVFATCIETTGRVISARRLATLRDLAATGSQARDVDTVLAAAAEVLSANPFDVPFALVYRVDAGSRSASLAVTSNVDGGSVVAPDHIDLERDGWFGLGSPLTGAARGEIELADTSSVHPDPWGGAPRVAISLPLFLPGRDTPAAMVV